MPINVNANLSGTHGINFAIHFTDRYQHATPLLLIQKERVNLLWCGNVAFVERDHFCVCTIKDFAFHIRIFTVACSIDFN